MHCDNCGSEVDEKDVYCGNCGHRIEKQTEVIDHTHDTDEFIDVTPDRSNEDVFTSANTSANATGSTFAGNTNNQSGAYNQNGTYNGAGRATTPPPVYKPKLSNSSATVSLVCGILSLLGVFTLITAIIGLTSSKKAMQLISTGEYDGESYAKAGKICSTIGLVFGILQVLWFVFYVFITLAVMFSE